MKGFVTKHTFFSVECECCDEADEVAFPDISSAVDMLQKRGWRKIGNYWHCYSCAEKIRPTMPINATNQP